MQRPFWFLTCKSCTRTFVHSEIGETQGILEYFFPKKPEFPAGGQELECVHCHAKAVYAQSELQYGSGKE